MTNSPTTDAQPGKGSGGRAKSPPPVSPGRTNPGNSNAKKSNPGNSNARNWSGQSRPRGYGGWTRRCHFAHYGCRGFYCPADATWYYWYAPFECYLPVRYLATYPPTTGSNDDPELPPGATP